MKRLQSSALGKGIAWGLMLVFLFLGAQLGLTALRSARWMPYSDVRQTWEFQSLLRNKEDSVAALFSVNQRLESEGLNYMERQQLTAQLEELREELWMNGGEKGSFCFTVRDLEGEEVFSWGVEQGQDISQAVDTVYYAWFELGHFYAEEGYPAQEAEAGPDGAPLPSEEDPGAAGGEEDPAQPDSGEAAPVRYVIECGVTQPFTGQDELSWLYQSFLNERNAFPSQMGGTVLCLALAAVCLCWILWSAGHGTEGGIVLTWQDNLFLEAYLLVLGGCIAPTVAVGAVSATEAAYRFEYYADVGMREYFPWILLGTAALYTLFGALCALMLRTLAVRFKARTLVRSTLLCRVLIWLGNCAARLWQMGLELARSLPFIWKTILLFCAYCITGAWMYEIGRYSDGFLFLWLLLQLAAFLFLGWWAIGFQRLRKGSRAIAAGELSYQIDTHRMFHDLRLHAEDLNNISVGMRSAVDQQMKSERFKAELITNVSHDLKTPLTSIINYVNLLQSTQQTDPKAVEYIEVLDRKSQRLKKLTEDLVEASKASTGTLSVNREKIGMGQLIDQALGEYGERLEARRLSVITTLPEEETFVCADGRHLWRVIDNLLSNCCKYAMEGTRVYLELTRGHGQVTLSVKNISREALNVPPERLMERFVRGEESRTTEGSGLGLSIARSLTEIQGGSFELVVDGDLFKAIVTMPQSA